MLLEGVTAFYNIFKKGLMKKIQENPCVGKVTISYKEVEIDSSIYIKLKIIK